MANLTPSSVHCTRGEYLSVCPDCGGSMRVIAALTEPGSIRRRLEGMGLSWPVPPIAPAGPEFRHPEEAPPDALDRSSRNSAYPSGRWSGANTATTT